MTNPSSDSDTNSQTPDTIAIPAQTLTILGAQLACRYDPYMLAQYLESPDAQDVIPQLAERILLDLENDLQPLTLSLEARQAYLDGLIEGLTYDRSDFDNVLEQAKALQ